MSEEERKAINNMKLFARVCQDMTVVTAKEMDTVLKLVERVQKENEELKEKNESLELEEKRRIIGKYGEFEIHKVINKVLTNDYIPVKKVKDKIEEYKKILRNCNKFSDVDRIKAINERILELQDLLGEEF